MKEQSKQISVYMNDKTLCRDIELLALSSNKSVQEIIRQALSLYRDSRIDDVMLELRLAEERKAAKQERETQQTKSRCAVHAFTVTSNSDCSTYIYSRKEHEHH